MFGTGKTRLHKAAEKGDLSDVCVAVQKNSGGINAQDSERGFTALHVAAEKGYDAIARELLTREANPDIVDLEGRTPLHLAAKQGHVEVVKALVRKKAKTNIRDKHNRTAHDYAVRSFPAVAALIAPPPDAPPAAHQWPSAAAPPPTTPGAGNHDLFARPLPDPVLATPRRPAPLAGAGPSWGAPPASPSPAAIPGYLSGGGAATPGSITPYGSGPAYVPSPAAVGYAVTGPAMEAPSAPPAAPPIGFQHLPTQQAVAGGVMPGVDGSGWAPRPAPQPVPFSAHNGIKNAADAAMHQLARLTMHRRSMIPTEGGGRPSPLDPATSSGPPPSEPDAKAGGGLLGRLAGLGNRGEKKGQKEKAPEGLGRVSDASSASEQGRAYTYETIAAATDDFSPDNKIGQGGFGAVYRGVLDGIPVAVKRMEGGPDAMQGQKEFAAEVNILTRLHHPHVVLLIGSCADQGLLVYELAEGGSLEERLFRPPSPGHALPWQDRVRIAAEVASALLYLHSAPQPIVHMDLKPANILLDRTLRAKLGDVGLARLMGHPASALAGAAAGGAPSTVQDTQLVGTMAYVDPEYVATGHFSPKSDIYALGIVMLQMLTGLEKGTVVSVVEEARRSVLQFEHVLDRRAGPWPGPEAQAFADIALKCTQFRHGLRPDLRAEVLPTLMQLRQRTALYDPPALAGVESASSGGAGADVGPHRRGSGPGGVPALFICPITQDLMRDPVVAADGYTYEKEAIEAWTLKANTSPMTNLPLPHPHTVPNITVRSAIQEWQAQQQAAGSRQ